ncbi:MAG: twin-arginine translocase TatA/TatE family subunit [Planctomycetes bacterium]|nr:twin-arginine translocase TatA/TatE family subunit [Planctomycetota bacterium]
MPGGMEWMVLLVLGLLIFGRRLPEVGRSLGRGIVEFKRGIKGIDDDIDEESSKPAERIEHQKKQTLESSTDDANETVESTSDKKDDSVV